MTGDQSTAGASNVLGDALGTENFDSSGFNNDVFDPRNWIFDGVIEFPNFSLDEDPSIGAGGLGGL